MLLISKVSLLVILESVTLQQSVADERLLAAISITELLSHYDSHLLDDALTVAVGLFLTPNIPLVSW